MKTLLLAGALVVSPLPVAAQDATLAAKAAVALGLERSCGYALNARARLFANSTLYHYFGGAGSRPLTGLLLDQVVTDYRKASPFDKALMCARADELAKALNR